MWIRIKRWDAISRKVIYEKLIYGLGAIAATVTPVVAVISCGKSDAKSNLVIKTQAELTKFLTDKGYADVTTASQAKILDKIKDKEITVVSGLINKTQETKAVHGANDFAILVKGTPKNATDENMVAQQPGEWLSTHGVLLAEAPTEAIDTTSSHNQLPASSLIARWGFTHDQMKEVQFVIFLQRDDNAAKAAPTAELMSVYVSPKHFGLGDFAEL